MASRETCWLCGVFDTASHRNTYGAERMEMITFRRRPQPGRAGRLIYDELLDEVGSIPTSFEEDFPFQWPEDVEPNPVSPRKRLGWRQVQLQADEDLVDYWARQRREHEQLKAAKLLRKLGNS